MAGSLRVPRSRGAFTGILLILLGLWGGLIPLIGPYLHVAYTPDKAWVVTNGRIWFEFLPSAVAMIGGILLATSRLRPVAVTGAVLAAASGGWFTFGTLVATLWMRTPPAQGIPVGGSLARAAEQLAFFTGIGALILCVAAVAFGRLSVVSARDLRVAERAAKTDTEPVPASPAPDTSTASAPADLKSSGSTPSAKPRTPMTALTRIASRNKPADQAAADTDSESISGDDRVGSGAARS
jgi:hypothetical protein